MNLNSSIDEDRLNQNVSICCSSISQKKNEVDYLYGMFKIKNDAKHNSSNQIIFVLNFFYEIHKNIPTI